VKGSEDGFIMKLAQREADLFSDYLKERLASGAMSVAVCLGVAGIVSERMGIAGRAGANPAVAKAYFLDFVALNYDSPEGQDPSVIGTVEDLGDGD